MLKRTDRSWGPAASIDNETLEVTLSCGMCIFRVFGPVSSCRADDPPRELASSATPDWCKYRQGILEDVEIAKADMLRKRAKFPPVPETRQ